MAKVPNFTVTFKDGSTVVARCGPKQIVAMERQYAISFEQMRTAEQLYFLAYQGLNSPTQFDDWLDLIDDVEEEPDEAVDPTPPGPGPGDSSS